MNQSVRFGTVVMNGKPKKTSGNPIMQDRRVKAEIDVVGLDVQTHVVRRVPAFWIYGLLMVLAVYTAVTCVKQETQIQTVRRAMSEIQVKIDRETKGNAQLQEQKVEITSDDSIEQIAREKLGYVKDGERIFVDSYK